MANFILLTLLFLSCFTAATLGFNVTTISFDEGYSHLFGGNHLVRSDDGRSVQLFLSRYTGSGFISSDMYHYGLFSASIKLPSDYTAGVVVAFYTSNGDAFPKTHDELDFEFLGNRKGEPWRVQTNVYGNGSTSRGREERYMFPFDPTQEAHRYSILWTSDTIIFYIDDIPIREVRRSDAMGGDYPSKPMSVYATIWDGSTWATENGKYRVDYKYAPFVSEFSDLILHGCRADPIEQLLSPSKRCSESEAKLKAADYAVVTPKKLQAMQRFRERYMTYSFCYDIKRYPITLPECNIIPSEKKRLDDYGNLKLNLRRRHSKRRSRIRSRSNGQTSM